MLWPISGFSFGVIPGWLTVVILLVEVGIRIVMVGVIPSNRRPSEALAWLLGIFFIPAVAFPLYLLIGTKRLSRRRTRLQRLIHDELVERTRHRELADDPLTGAPAKQGLSSLNRTLGAFPLHEGNHLQLLPDYEESVAWMVQAIDGATSYVHAVFYIVGDDPEYAGPVLDAMERAAARGVSVRLLYDHVGTLRVPGYLRLRRRLRESRIESHALLPIRPLRRRFSRLDLRNHRKILVVDGEVALTGSMNLIEPHYQKASARRMGRRWVELNTVVTGPVVSGLDIVFGADWLVETEESLEHIIDVDMERDAAATGGSLAQVVPSGPGFPVENNLHLFNHMLYAATRRIVICTPYLVPDDSLLYAITGAAHRGVEVTLMVSGRADQFLVHHAQQSYYEELMSAGVRITRYPAPDVLHSKFIIVDDDMLVIGSSNMDMRSFGLNYEVSLFVVDPDVVAEADAVFASYAAKSDHLDLQRWRHRPIPTRYADNVCRLFSGLL
ncbi:MAG: cardiolipin synthase [Mobilicoccus sp.]|nr:cardiolipin synthase [Mobilicoccus sp.]